jgi:hypothetical protein
MVAGARKEVVETTVHEVDVLSDNEGGTMRNWLRAD